MSEQEIQSVINKLKNAKFCMVAYEGETGTGVYFNAGSTVIQNGLSALVERHLQQIFNEQERAFKKNKPLKTKAK